MERGEDLPKLIALVHVDVSVVTATLLPARQSFLRLPVGEASEGALLGQTSHVHLQPGAQRARVTKSHGVTQDKVCCLNQAALLRASPSLGGLPFTLIFCGLGRQLKDPFTPHPRCCWESAQ